MTRFARSVAVLIGSVLVLASCAGAGTAVPSPGSPTASASGIESGPPSRVPSAEPSISAGSSSSPAVAKTIHELLAEPLVPVDPAEITTVSQDEDTFGEAHCKAALTRETPAERALDREIGCLVWMGSTWWMYVGGIANGTPENPGLVDYGAVRHTYAVALAVLGPEGRAGFDAVLADQLDPLTRPKLLRLDQVRKVDRFLAEPRLRVPPASLLTAVHDAVTHDLAMAVEEGYQATETPTWLEVVDGDSRLDQCVRGVASSQGDGAGISTQGDACFRVLRGLYGKDYLLFGGQRYYDAGLTAFRIGYAAVGGFGHGPDCDTTACPRGFVEQIRADLTY